MENFISLNDPLSKFHIFLSGDFNLPKYCWGDLYTSSVNGSAYNRFNKFMEQLMLSQYVKSNTRHNNILDLFLTNDSNFVQYIECLDIFISDHLLIQIYTNFFKNLNTESQIIQIDSNELNFLNFDLNKANFKEINYYLSKIDWQSFVAETSVEDFPVKFNQLVFSSLTNLCPLKRSRKNTVLNSHQKSRKIIARKIRRYNKQIQQLKNTSNIMKFQTIKKNTNIKK